MPKPSDMQHWRADDERIERAGFADWQERKMRDEDLPIAEALADAGRDKATAVLNSFLQFCLPPKTYGDVRRFRAGYFRMVAVVWRLSPEMLEPCRTDADVAARLGITRRAFEKHLDRVDSLLASSGKIGPTTYATRKKCKSTTCNGSSRGRGAR